MQGRFKKPEYLFVAALFLLAVNVCIYHAALAPRLLTVSVLDIGQGDAILVRGPTGVTMLIDGGPDRSILRELGAVLPLGARNLDIVVETHPDKDHIGGLADVFEQYEVGYFLEPGIPNDTSAAQALAMAVSAEPDLEKIVARRGMRLALGGGAYADILYPDRDVSKVDTNDGSITMRVVYGATSFMLTGDLPLDIENWLVMLDRDDGELDADVLKAAHHGSKYSTGDAWLAALAPSMVAISVGEKNSYGHPTPETLARVAKSGATVARTDRDGRLIFTSNGVAVTRK